MQGHYYINNRQSIDESYYGIKCLMFMKHQKKHKVINEKGKRWNEKKHQYQTRVP